MLLKNREVYKQCLEVIFKIGPLNHLVLILFNVLDPHDVKRCISWIAGMRDTLVSLELEV